MLLTEQLILVWTRRGRATAAAAAASAAAPRPPPDPDQIPRKIIKIRLKEEISKLDIISISSQK